MSELDKLIENYFAPRPKTLTKKMLYEMFDAVLEEQGEEIIAYGEEITIFLRDNGYPEAELKEWPAKLGRRGTFTITNIGNPKERDEAISKLKTKFDLVPMKKYSTASKYYIGGKLPIGNNILLKQGANPTGAEDLTLAELQSNIAQIIKDYGLDPKEPISIKVTGDGAHTFASDLYWFNTTPSAINIKKTPKADFAIGSVGEGKEQVFISHKQGKEMEPSDFGQWSGMTKRAGEDIANSKEVQAFGQIVTNILEKVKTDIYPSGIDFQMNIKSKDLMLRAVFGKDYGKKESSKDNVDYVIQGDLRLEPLFTADKGNTDDEPVFKGKFVLRGSKVLARRVATVRAAEEIDDLESLFKGGYLPILSIRRGEAKRNNLGISAGRAQINPEKGREINFLIAPGSTPANIEFSELCLTSRQFKNVKKFFADLEKKSITPENTMYAKLRGSVLNFSNEDCGKE